MRILVADDEPASAAGLTALLEIVGHEVVGPARDGDEAVALALRERPDLAILDIDMPRLSGLDAAARIARTRPVPVILLSAHREPEYLERAASLPVFNYLTKPCAPDSLIPAIRIARARFEEWSSLRGRVGELTQRMEERTVVERAKGILMRARGIGEDEAYVLMRRQSQQQSRSMTQIARALVAGEGFVVRAGPMKAKAAPG
ncbi:MAG: transcriptional regulator [Gemmatimonadetes bacterium]|nr:transcriptional regulator [Gemmatimonadota bacterium]